MNVRTLALVLALALAPALALPAGAQVSDVGPDAAAGNASDDEMVTDETPEEALPPGPWWTNPGILSMAFVALTLLVVVVLFSTGRRAP